MLLTSSWLLAMALKSIRTGAASARAMVLGAIGFGFAFLAGKIFEYVQKARSGIDPSQTEFYTFYFVFTGIHMVHLLVGLALLCLVIYPATQGTSSYPWWSSASPLVKSI